MAAGPTCLQCSQVVSSEDTVERDGDRVVHLDCRRPRRLSLEERALLYRYCWDHAVGECESCARTFRQDELLAGLSADGTDLCPQCRKDLTDSVRAHLYGCAMLPAEVRRRAQDTRASTQALLKQSGELHDRADVLLREAEVARAASRAASQSTTEMLRRLIQYKLRDGSLPHAGIPPTIPGRPGDGSTCGACEKVVTSRELMMVVTLEAHAPSAPREMKSVPLHPDCFQIWNEERRSFKPSY
jgi:hypothetical protein